MSLNTPANIMTNLAKSVLIPHLQFRSPLADGDVIENVIRSGPAGVTSLAIFFGCLEGAKALVLVLVGDWIPTSYIRFATDGAYTGYVSRSDTTPAIGATHIFPRSPWRSCCPRWVVLQYFSFHSAPNPVSL